MSTSKEEVARVSSNRLAERIGVPVFRAGGGEDKRGSIAHTGTKEKAPRAADGTVETHDFRNPLNELNGCGKSLNFSANASVGAGR